MGKYCNTFLIIYIYPRLQYFFFPECSSITYIYSTSQLMKDNGYELKYEIYDFLYYAVTPSFSRL